MGYCSRPEGYRGSREARSANPTVAEGGVHIDPSDAVSPTLKENIIGLGGTWHVHPSGELLERVGNLSKAKNFSQAPSEEDRKQAGFGINIVIGAREKNVYFYDNFGVIDRPMKLQDFLKGC